MFKPRRQTSPRLLPYYPNILIINQNMELQNEPLATSTNENGTEAAAITPAEQSDTPKPVQAYATKAEIVDAVKILAQKPAEEILREEVNRLKVQFYALERERVSALLAEYMKVEGNEESDFVAEADPADEEFKAAMQEIKDKKSEYLAKIATERLDNLLKKNAIIEEINAAADDTDSVHRHLDRVHELQTQFKEIGAVPDTDTSDLWRRYQQATERFYDQLRVNKDLRDLDFRKNLESKTLICEEAQRLADEPDIVVAFRRLQELHDKWREIGPVAKELREEIWTRFKDASAVVNKKYQSFFEERKAVEQANEAAKTALCERVEAIRPEELTNNAAWDEATKTVLSAQEEWKTLGFASRKVNTELFKRFRKLCDGFFAAKAAYFKQQKDIYNDNLARKISLCERAEELKESTDWRKATDAFVELQNRWRTIGAVPKKQSDAVWTRFRAACDYFFERKKQSGSETRRIEQTNLKAKRDVIEQLKAITAESVTDRNEAVAKVRELMDLYQHTGHVPFRDKDKLHEAYRAEVSRLYDTLDMNNKRAARAAFEESVNELAGNEHELQRQRERLLRSAEMKRNEIKTFENNLGFFNSRSRSGEAMLRDMQSRMARLREELDSIQSKISLIDSKING